MKNVGKTERNVVKAKERDSWLDKRGGNSVSAPFILTEWSEREGLTCA